MIIDQLISNYLDGDLAPEDDVELRRLLTADPDARASFDAAVLLHIAMRCEDDEDLPVLDRERVRLAVHERIVADRARRSSASGTSMRRAATMLAIIIAAWVPVHDLQIASPQASTVAATELMSMPAALQQGLTPIAAADQGQAPPAVAALMPSAMPTETLAEGLPSAQPAEDVTLRVRLLSAEDNVSVPTAAHEEIRTMFDSPALPTSIMLSTSYAQGMTSGTRTEGGVTQIAQSIGYSISDRAHIGLELGTMVYDVHMTYTGTVGPSAAMSSVLEEGQPQTDGDLSKLPAAVNPGQQLERRQFDGVEHTSQLWGAAFYQHEFVRTGILSLRGRLGAGAGQAGPLSYIRLQAETSLLHGVSVSLGTEGRLAPFRTGAVSGSASSTAYGAILSVIYGIRIDL